MINKRTVLEDDAKKCFLKILRNCENIQLMKSAIFADTKLPREGFINSEIVNSPADIAAKDNDGNLWYFEIKATSKDDTYFGAATATEWYQAFKDQEHFRFVIAIKKPDGVFDFKILLPKEMLLRSTIPPFKINFNLNLKSEEQKKANHRAGTIGLSEDVFEKLYKSFEEVKSENLHKEQSLNIK